MHSRGDQLAAYRFLRRRVVTALMLGAPNSRDFPLRRLVPTAFAGFMAAAVLLGAAAVLGVLNPGHTSDWKQGESLVIERETGARYVYFQGSLHPMLNFASARLYLGDGEAKVYTVARSALAGVPRAAPLGIVGAPDALPGSGDLVTGPWSVCVGPDGRVTMVAGSAVAGTTVAGSTVDGSTPGGADLGLQNATLVAASEQGDRYLIWRDQRLRIAAPGVLAPLGLTDPTPRLVGAPWLNTVPLGPDLTYPDIPGRGGVGPTVAGHALRVGQLVEVRNTVQTQYAVVLADGLAPVSALVAGLIQADPRFADAYPGQSVGVVELAPSEYSQANRLSALAGSDRYPAQQLTAVGGPGSVDSLCSTLTDAATGAVTVSAVDRMPTPARSIAAVGASATPLADQVVLPAGHGALVREVPQPGVTSGAVFLLTDDGTRFRIDSAAAQSALGYASVTPVALPPGFLDLLPIGPTLSRAAAGSPAG
jgi:type VII secretion protein EccB